MLVTTLLVLDLKNCLSSFRLTTEEALRQHQDRQLMRCRLLRYQIGISVPILTVLCAKTNSNWDLRPGKCHVTTYITQTALYRGWASTTLALSAAKNCQHRDSVAVAAAQVVTELGAAAVLVVAPTGGKIPERIVEDVTHYRICGHFAHLVQAPATLHRPPKVVPQLRMKTTTTTTIPSRWDTPDGLSMKVSSQEHRLWSEFASKAEKLFCSENELGLTLRDFLFVWKTSRWKKLYSFFSCKWCSLIWDGMYFMNLSCFFVGCLFLKWK